MKDTWLHGFTKISFVLFFIFASSCESKKGDVVFLEGKQYKLEKSVEAVVTAYCTCAICCEKFSDGITSIGADARVCNGIAVDPRLIPYGYAVKINGIGFRIADDTGGAMRKDGKNGIYHIDVRMESHSKARNWGKKTFLVDIYAPIPEQRKGEPETPRIYTVVSGDNLWNIGKRHGVSVKALVKLNNLQNPDKIYPGQTLKLKQ